MEVSRLVDPFHFRHVVGHLASGVTVVTAAHEGTTYGMTASSVTSLSADPPLMLACINNAVPTAEAVSRAGRYVVNILGEGQGDIAHQFAHPATTSSRASRCTPATSASPCSATRSRTSSAR